MVRIEKTITSWAERFNWVSCAAILVMMILTTLDVILRFFRRPIPGTYEIVGLLGAIAVSFSLAYTSVEQGHIAVEVLVRRFSRRTQALVTAVNALIAAALFGVIAWQGAEYAADLMQKGEVSLTVQVPIYPVAYGVAAGCALLCPILLVEFSRALRAYRSFVR